VGQADHPLDTRTASRDVTCETNAGGHRTIDAIGTGGLREHRPLPAGPIKDGRADWARPGKRVSQSRRIVSQMH
jgi:hypothetical protein